MASSIVHIRVDGKIKAAATETLAQMGLTVSDAVRLLLTRVAIEKALPFDVRVPGPERQEAHEQIFPTEGVGPLKETLTEEEAYLVGTGQMKLAQKEMAWDAFWAAPRPSVSDKAVREAIEWAKGDR
jgi:addiction module RelB/DinJ family antitoxin